MGGEYVANPITFLIGTLGGLYILAMMLRFLLQWVRADFYNPVSQFLVKITQPALGPLRRVIPGWGGVDLAAVALMIILQMLLLAAILALRGLAAPLGFLFFEAVAELVRLLLNVFLFAIIIQVILSWVNPDPYNPIVRALRSLTEPVFDKVRRLIPFVMIGGLDLSPIAVLLGIKFVQIFAVQTLYQLAAGL